MLHIISCLFVHVWRFLQAKYKQRSLLYEFPLADSGFTVYRRLPCHYYDCIHRHVFGNCANFGCYDHLMQFRVTDFHLIFVSNLSLLISPLYWIFVRRRRCKYEREFRREKQSTNWPSKRAIASGFLIKRTCCIAASPSSSLLPSPSLTSERRRL